MYELSTWNRNKTNKNTYPIVNRRIIIRGNDLSDIFAYTNADTGDKTPNSGYAIRPVIIVKN